MVTELEVPSGHGMRLVVEPNRSLTSEGYLYFILSLLALSLVVSLVFAFLGAWVVLPFAALEIGLLISIFYYVNRHLRCMEVISIDQQHVLIEKGAEQVDQRWDFDRPRVKVVIQDHNEPSFNGEIITISGDQGIVCLGEFLNEQDAGVLIDSLKKSGLRTSRQGPYVAYQF